MTTKKSEAQIFDYAPINVIPPSTSCKHGEGECDICGTSDRRDVKHTTKGGDGPVAALRKKRR